MVRVAINGFGRIGRMIFRAGFNDPSIEWVAFNDISVPEELAYLLKFDTVAHRFKGDVSFDDRHVIVNEKKIPVFAERDPSKLPWKDMNVDVVIECTGFFTKHDQSKLHLDAGAKRVLISAPSHDPDITIVKGVNEHLYDASKHFIVSMASCTTNSLAPMVKVLNDNFGIVHGFMSTVHAYTADQRILDAPSTHHKDLRRSRAAGANTIPTETGAAKAIGQVVPELNGKLDGMAFRVPVTVGSITDLSVVLKKSVTVEEVNHLFHEVANYHMKGILEYSDEPLVSSDIIGNAHSCIFDAKSTKVIDGTLVKVIGWYDNEWGYSNRMVDVIKIIGV
ncbi:MAG: type I glyceraldehyde-3-phosphate dehydrogenase [Candidatus Woesearchaeota archaeon]